MTFFSLIYQVLVLFCVPFGFGLTVFLHSVGANPLARYPFAADARQWARHRGTLIYAVRLPRACRAHRERAEMYVHMLLTRNSSLPTQFTCADYDTLVAQTECPGTSDTLACLPCHGARCEAQSRTGRVAVLLVVPVTRACVAAKDGVFLTDCPHGWCNRAGKCDPFPCLFSPPTSTYTGDCDDEGTLFSLLTLSVT